VNAVKRFYREVSVEAAPAGGAEYRVLLDGKAIRTPVGAPLAVPSQALAEAIAAEWRGQGDTIRPDSMILTKLVNTAIDQVRPNRQTAIAQILAFAKTDLVCYRAETPQSLIQRQNAQWDPLLDWARTRHGASLTCGVGITYVEQSPEALASLERAIAAHDDFALAGLHAAATLLGSAVIALAFWDSRLDPEQAFAAAQLDEVYQAERWGQDSEAQILSRKKAAELADIERFLRFFRE
jgi:chaperone required for assembly of F1-ATPase